ncbi:uncharacterized protein LOC118504343 [Anopheles stephensi]|uniref:uncharacterized protein LOC118504343 n=1 Tax=Anopheles stephensi TaxID=30069 RepID=UPI001658B602|nr:uncharacterized protein LOC118504343 [Anopheles stephensi]
MCGVMPLALRFELLSLRLLVRSTVSNPLIIENFNTLHEIGSKCKIMNTYHDFASLQVHPSSPENVNRASLPGSCSSRFIVDTSLKEDTKSISDSLRRTTIPSIFMEKYGHLNRNQFYTDGSSSEQGIGFGVYNIDSEAFFQLRRPCSIYIAELAAIFYALLIISACPPDEYFIFSDSLSAVEALKSVKAIKSPDYFVKEILKVLSSLFEKSFRISLVWLPAHCGILGNEKADQLAKKGASEGSLFDRPILPHEHMRAPQSLCMARWQSMWDTDELGRFLYSITPQVSLKPWFQGISGDRAFIRMMSRLRSNHFALGAHLQRIGRADSKTCGCGLGYHDIDHILWSCLEYEAARPSLLDAVRDIGRTPNVPIRDLLGGGDDAYLRAIFEFCRANEGLGMA